MVVAFTGIVSRGGLHNRRDIYVLDMAFWKCKRFCIGSGSELSNLPRKDLITIA
jgi:hypothetical protein